MVNLHLMLSFLARPPTMSERLYPINPEATPLTRPSPYQLRLFFQHWKEQNFAIV